MNTLKNLNYEIIKSFPQYDKESIDKYLSKSLEKLNKKIIVLDDDPTGIQTVNNVSVYTSCNENSIREGFLEENTMFFLLTNSRGLTSVDSRKLHDDIAKNISKIAKELNKDFIIISRSDSILRGHYPLETIRLKEILEETSDKKFDGEIFCPFFKEGGRFTIDNIHYVASEKELIPAADTEFAKDPTFGYKSSHLGEWIEEKTRGEYKKENIVYISLKELRNFEIDKITEKLMNIENFNKVVVNAVDYMDIKVFIIAFINAINNGKNFIIRSAAAIPKILGNISDIDLLNKKDLVSENNENGGIIVVGSYTNKTTKQLLELKNLSKVKFIEFNSDLVLDKEKFKDEINNVVKICDKEIENGITLAIYTKREPLNLKDKSKDEILKISVEISDGLTSVVKLLSVKPSFIIAKGGITSSDVGTKALNVNKAKVLGQVADGIPVWQTDENSKFPKMSYIIFPGNVGDNNTLKNIVEKLI